MANSLDPDQTLHCLNMPFCQQLWCMKFQDTYHIPKYLSVPDKVTESTLTIILDVGRKLTF